MKLYIPALLCLSVATFARMTGITSSWVIDVLSSLPVQYGLLCLALVPLCMADGKLPLAVVACALALVNLSVLVRPPARPVHAGAGESGVDLKTYSANVWVVNPSLRALVRDIERHDPDLVFLVEVRAERAEQLQPLASRYPYRRDFLRKGGSGLVLLSRWPIEESRLVDVGDERNRPLLEARLDVRGRPVRVYGMHPKAPVRPRQFRARNRQLEWVAGEAAKRGEPVVVLGDLNVTPYSPSFRTLLDSGLTDARRQARWRTSWPAPLFVLGIPIDHVLVGGGIEVRDMRRGRFIGSDHYPVVVRMRISGSAEPGDDRHAAAPHTRELLRWRKAAQS